MVGADPDIDDPLDIAQWYANEKGRKGLLTHVRTEVGKHKQPGKLHMALATLGVPVIFTTNYDQLLESAVANVEGVPPDVIIHDEHVGLLDDVRRTTVIKLHGCLSLPESIVLARDEYETFPDTHPAMIAYLQSLLATRTFLFIGTSLSDPDFRSLHAAIRRALGKYQRPAYLLDGRPKKNAHVKDWKQRGIEMLLLPSYDVELAYIQAIGNDARGHRTIKAIANTLELSPPPPSIESKALTGSFRILEDTLNDIVSQARTSGLIFNDGDAAVESGPEGNYLGWDERRHRQDKLRAILNLAQSIDELAPLSQPDTWIDLGGMLYELGDSTGAIQAYNNLLRPHEGLERIDPSRLNQIRGNLARAYLHDRHYDRAEWLLRQCVFRTGRESHEDTFTRPSVFKRLNLTHLARRPSDASELTYALTRRAERLRESGHLAEAFEVLDEARYLIEPLLGVSKDPALNRDYFSVRFHDDSVRRQWNRGARSYPRAWAFNFLGKCYRLTCSLVLDFPEIRDNTLYYLKGAIKNLRYASRIDPALRYPWAHRLNLYEEFRLPHDWRKRILRETIEDLQLAIERTGDKALVKELMQRATQDTIARAALADLV